MNHVKPKHATKNNYKGKKIVSLLLGSLIFFVGVAYFATNVGDKNNLKSVVNTIEGEVILSNKTNIKILISDNQSYIFDVVNVSFEGEAVTLGTQVAINYVGNLDNQSSKAQEVNVQKILVKTIDNHPITDNKSPIEILGQMTLEEKVAQMFMVRVPTISPVKLIKDYQFGGYILFNEDFKNKSESTVKANIQAYQDVSKIPMLIGTDEEGGTVVRVSRYFRNSPFKSPQNIYKDGGYEAIINDVKEKSALLKDLGINLNFAPVADVSTNPNDFIYPRAFGKTAKDTAKYIETVIKAMNEVNEGSVLKHFPGYGNNIDTHTKVAYDKRSLASFKKSDFLPFIAGINAGAKAILVSHNVMESVDPNNPASLSSNVHEILRNDLQFNGVVITDDLKMDGVKAYGTSGEVAVKAVQAGNDMLISSDAIVQLKAIINAVQAGQISQSQIDQSVIKILTWKKDLGIIK